VTFLKAVWRFMVGVKDLLVLCLLLVFFAGLYAALSMTPGERPMRVHEGALFVDLDGTLVEQTETADPLSVLFGGEAPVSQYALRDVVGAIDAARADPKVKAIVLDLDGFLGGGQTSLMRVGAALDRARAAKKTVIAYATLYDDASYLLASHASEVWLNPLGGVALTGPGGSNLYFQGLMEKLGITAHIYRVGTYKSAVEPFMRADQSPEAKAAAQSLADNLWAFWREDVAKARPAARIAPYSSHPVEAIEAAQGDLAAAALGARLVDKIGDRATFEAHVARLAGDSRDSDGPAFAAIGLRDYAHAHRPGGNGQIGVLTIAGDIVDGEAGPGTAGGDSIARMLQDALDRRDLKALVVRVDSPGGSVLAAERIRSALAQAKAGGLPIVVSMGDVAASGGYWVSTTADRIFAEPSTITGSIGVFGILPSFEGLLGKIGITTDGVGTTPLSGEPDLLGGVSPEFNRISQLSVENIYHRFLGLVAQARGMRPERVDGIAQGRVWDGGTAHQLGLVDRFGGLDDAVAEAARLAKLDPAKARPYYIEPEVDPFTAFVTQMFESEEGTSPSGSTATDLFGRQALARRALLDRAINEARQMAEGGSVQARCLECGAYSARSDPGASGASGVLRVFASSLTR